MMLIFYILILVALQIYSFALVDPNLTLINHPLWVSFRDAMVQFGYFQRANSWYTYVVIILLLSVCHYLIVKNFKKYNPIKLSLIIGGILIFSYPFLSHDFFNYIFDAKIFTFYGQNPYTHIPANFAEDEWLRFMHWVDRTYPYGPSFLVLTFIPSFLGLGKFILNFFFFKLFSAVFYFLGVYFLQKIDKKTAIIFATHPLILIEGLVNAHNDLIGVSFAIIGIYFILQNKQIQSRIYFLLSAGIKYVTLPVILLQKKNEKINLLVLIAQIAMVAYLSISREPNAWYYLTFFAYLPIFKTIITRLSIFFFGLLLSYYPYIYLGGWDSSEKIFYKNAIIILSLGINIFYLLIKRKEVAQEFSLGALLKS